jgi:hypothetical protein
METPLLPSGLGWFVGYGGRGQSNLTAPPFQLAGEDFDVAVLDALFGLALQSDNA